MKDQALSLEPRPPTEELEIIPLGGWGEIGLNMLLLQCREKILVIDAGLMFPEDHMLGVDIVIPDFSYLLRHQERVLAVVLTHGHEDHIGALPFLLRELAVPVYGSRFTLELVREKLKEHQLLDQVDLRPVKAREVLDSGPFCHRIHPGHPQHPRRTGAGHPDPPGDADPFRGFQDRPHAHRRRGVRPEHLRRLREPGGPGPHVRFDQRGAGGLHPAGKADRGHPGPDHAGMRRPGHCGRFRLQHQPHPAGGGFRRCATAGGWSSTARA